MSYSSDFFTGERSIFMENPFGNDTFRPIRIPARHTAEGIVKPKPPEPPLVPYFRYNKDVFHRVKAENPNLKLWEIGKIIGQRWRMLSDVERLKYQTEYNMEKMQYDEALKAYHNSSSYQAWLTAKARGMADDGDNFVPDVDQAARFGIAPADDESADDSSFSMRHFAEIRYRRNHELMAEIFSDFVLPDERGVVNEEKLSKLRDQVDLVMEHVRKLNESLEESKKQHAVKKRRISDESTDFLKRFEQLCSKEPKIDKEQFDKMVEDYSKQIRAQYELRAAQMREQFVQSQQQPAQSLTPQQQPNPVDVSSSSANPAGTENVSTVADLAASDQQGEDVSADKTDDIVSDLVESATAQTSRPVEDSGKTSPSNVDKTDAISSQPAENEVVDSEKCSPPHQDDTQPSPKADEPAIDSSLSTNQPTQDTQPDDKETS